MSSSPCTCTTTISLPSALLLKAYILLYAPSHSIEEKKGSIANTYDLSPFYDQLDAFYR